MMRIRRYASALLLAGGVTFFLFFLMQYLIHYDLRKGQEEVLGQVIDIARVNRETDTLQKRRKPKQRQAQQQPPPPPMNLARNTKPSNNMNMGPMFYVPNFRMAGGPGVGGAPSDADVMPIVRVPPTYPARAQERGIEGWVLLEFSISKAGTVQNPMVVDADPPNIFNRAAMRAVLKWKYKPKIEDGVPVERHGVQTVISFELEDT